MSSFWVKVRAWNIRLSRWMLPSVFWQTRGFAMYDWIARALLADPGVRVIADLGGGRTWHFDTYREREGFKIIGLDVSRDELDLNPEIDQAVIGDVCAGIDLPDQSVDLILCRATVEHLHDTAAFLRHAYRILKPGGRAAFVFANTWAPPMIINRLLPHWLAVRILKIFLPGIDGYGGFKAYYDKCTYRQFERASEEIGYSVIYGHCSYYSSAYFEFFAPLHALSLFTDMIRMMLSIKLFSSMNLFVLQRPVAGQLQCAEPFSLVPMKARRATVGGMIKI